MQKNQRKKNLNKLKPNHSVTTRKRRLEANCQTKPPKQILFNKQNKAHLLSGITKAIPETCSSYNTSYQKFLIENEERTSPQIKKPTRKSGF